MAYGSDLLAVPIEKDVGAGKSTPGQMLQDPVLKIQGLKVLARVGDLQHEPSMGGLVVEEEILVAVRGQGLSPVSQDLEPFVGDSKGLLRREVGPSPG